MSTFIRIKIEPVENFTFFLNYETEKHEINLIIIIF